MNFNEVKELLQLFDQSTIREFDIAIDNVDLHMSKNEHRGQALVNTPQLVETKTQVADQPIISPATPAVSPAEALAPAAPAAGKTVNSPIVGVVYLSSAPDKPVFKKVGDSVEVGETLCIVEAMKLMNEITSDIAGTITEILIENEQVVEYGQPLFRIV